MFSGPDGFGVLSGERDRIECDVSGFKTETLDEGFRFRCVKCNNLQVVAVEHTQIKSILERRSEFRMEESIWQMSLLERNRDDRSTVKKHGHDNG